MQDGIPATGPTEERTLDADGKIKFVLKVDNEHEDAYRELKKQLKKGGELFIGVRNNQTTIQAPAKALLDNARQMLEKVREDILTAASQIEDPIRTVAEEVKGADHE